MVKEKKLQPAHVNRKNRRENRLRDCCVAILDACLHKIPPHQALPVLLRQRVMCCAGSGRDTGWLSNLFGTAGRGGCVVSAPSMPGVSGLFPLVIIALLAGADDLVCPSESDALLSGG